MHPVIPLKIKLRPRPPLTPEEQAFVDGPRPYMISLCVATVVLLGSMLIGFTLQPGVLSNDAQSLCRQVLVFVFCIAVGGLLVCLIQKLLRPENIVSARELRFIRAALGQLDKRLPGK